MSEQETYTPQQVMAIREAIRKGREAFIRNDEHPRIFASAFIRAGGLHLPGEELDRETRLRMEIHIMANINGRFSGTDEPPRIRASIQREVTRIYDEVERFRVLMHAHPIGYRLTIGKKVAKRACCERYTKLDIYGLGPGVVPPQAIVVLPPCCDGIHWEPIYEEES
jgi:hypothetical protein